MKVCRLLVCLLPVALGSFLSVTAAPSPAVRAVKIADFQFTIPASWSSEDLNGGLLLMAPDIEDDWQANAFVEISADASFPPMDGALAKLAEGLAANKPQYKELKRSTGKLVNGFSFGVVEYSTYSKPTKLHDRQFVVEISPTKRMYVLVSSAESRWDKYSAIFDQMLQSLAAAGAKNS